MATLLPEPSLSQQLQASCRGCHSCLLTQAGLHGCRRRIGRWLTDVTPLLPLLSSSKCTFHLQTVSWALTWQPSLTLRFRNSSHAATAIEGGSDSQRGGNPVSDAGLESRPGSVSSSLGAPALRSVAQDVANEWGKGGSSATARRLQRAANSNLHPGAPVLYTEPDSRRPMHKADTHWWPCSKEAPSTPPTIARGGRCSWSPHKTTQAPSWRLSSQVSSVFLRACLRCLSLLSRCICEKCLSLLSRCKFEMVMSPAGHAVWPVRSDLEAWPVICFNSVAAASANEVKGSISRQPFWVPILLQGMAATSSSVPSFAQLRTISL